MCVFGWKSDANVIATANTTVADAEALVKAHKKALIIDENGTNLGVVFVAEAWAQAKARGLALAKVRDGDVPVIRFEQVNQPTTSGKEKRATIMDPSSEVLHDRMKEVRVSDHISEHDLQVKVGKARQQLLSKYKVRFDMRFKRRSEFDPVLAQMTMENVFARLQDVAHYDTPFKVGDTGAFMVLKPHSRKSLIAEGHVQVADPDAPKELTRRQISAAKRQLAAMEKEELRAQGIKFKKYLTPDEQIRQSSTNGDDFDIKAPKPKAKPAVEDEDDVYDMYNDPAMADRINEVPRSKPSRPTSPAAAAKKRTEEEDEDEDDDMFDEDDEDEDDELLDDILPKKTSAAKPISKPISKPIPGRSTGRL